MALGVGGAGRWSVVDVLLPAVRTPLGGLQIPKALPALHPHDQHTLSMEVPAHRPALGVGLGGPLSHEIWALHLSSDLYCPFFGIGMKTDLSSPAEFSKFADIFSVAL